MRRRESRTDGSQAVNQRFLTQAVRNLSVAKKLKSTENEWCVFLCHQSAELAMKSLLLSLGHDWRRLKDPSHSLSKIWSDFLFSSKHFKQSDLALLDAVYIDSRYPQSFTPEVQYSKVNTDNYVDATERILKTCQLLFQKLDVVRKALSE